MILPLLIRPLAQKEIDAAARWYAVRSADLARRFLDAIDRTFGQIVEWPRSFPVTYRTLRRALTHRFPYAACFSISASRIDVVGVLHGKQSRKRLRGRE